MKLLVVLSNLGNLQAVLLRLLPCVLDSASSSLFLLAVGSKKGAQVAFVGCLFFVCFWYCLLKVEITSLNYIFFRNNLKICFSCHCVFVRYMLQIPKSLRIKNALCIGFTGAGVCVEHVVDIFRVWRLEVPVQATGRVVFQRQLCGRVCLGPSLSGL